jgi:hypothetical protein
LPHICQETLFPGRFDPRFDGLFDRDSAFLHGFPTILRAFCTAVRGSKFASRSRYNRCFFDYATSSKLPRISGNSGAPAAASWPTGTGATGRSARIAPCPWPSEPPPEPCITGSPDANGQAGGARGGTAANACLLRGLRRGPDGTWHPSLANGTRSRYAPAHGPRPPGAIVQPVGRPAADQPLASGPATDRIGAICGAGLWWLPPCPLPSVKLHSGKRHLLFRFVIPAKPTKPTKRACD